MRSTNEIVLDQARWLIVDFGEDAEYAAWSYADCARQDGDDESIHYWTSVGAEVALLRLGR